MEALNFKLSQNGYILNSENEIEIITYKNYLREFGADETTTARGVAPRLYVEESTVYTWGVAGNNHKIYKYCDNKTEAKMFLYACFENYVIEKNWDAPRFFTKKLDLLEDLSDRLGRELKVIKRYFRIKTFIEKRNLDEKLERQRIFETSKPIAKDDILKFISENETLISESLNELDILKSENNQKGWQIKANALVQKASKNDFRFLKWNEIYKLIRENS